MALRIQRKQDRTILLRQSALGSRPAQRPDIAEGSQGCIEHAARSREHFVGLDGTNFQLLEHLSTFVDVSRSARIR
jgi:hypothetical protein